jgi:hypothetical protein
MQHRGKRLDLMPRGEGHMGDTILKTDGFEILKHALTYVRYNSFLWPLAFVIALAGGGAQGFSLWVQSPVYRGFTGYSPVHLVGDRIVDYAEGNPYFWVLFIAAGVIVALAVIAFGVIAQAAAVGGVADIDSFSEGRLKRSWRDGLDAFPRAFKLTLGYLVLMVLLAFPSFLLFWLMPDSDSIFLLLAGLLLGGAFVLIGAVLMAVVEFAFRYLVLQGTRVVESVRMSVATCRKYWREVLVTYLYVLIINIAAGFGIVILMAVIGSPLVWIFEKTTENHNPFLIAVSILVFFVAWALSAALLGVFAITASAVWTLTFIDLQTAMHTSDQFERLRMPARPPLDSVPAGVPGLASAMRQGTGPSPIGSPAPAWKAAPKKSKGILGTIGVLLLLPIARFFKPKQKD